MQVTDVRSYESPRSLSAAHRASYGGAAFVPPPLPMAGDRARIRRRPARRAQALQNPSLLLGGIALAFLLLALVLALGLGHLGGAFGLLLGWLSAALAFVARRELMILLERVAR